jgi:hypothetical protein
MNTKYVFLSLLDDVVLNNNNQSIVFVEILY